MFDYPAPPVPSLREMIRRFAAVALFLFGLFHILLWTLPYTGFPAFWIAKAANGDPLTGLLLSVLALFGLFFLVRNLRRLGDAGISYCYRAVCLVI
ncbi:MAG: hypothetical protein KBG72_00305 [Agrobacterium sp.]|nr:hypothetical protein [Agrobacterium sp.]